MKTIRLSYNEITFDKQLQARGGINEDQVDHYYQALLNGEKLPPPVVCKLQLKRSSAKYYLLDGWHRLYAIRKVEKSLNGNSDPVFTCQLMEDITNWTAALKYAIGANKTNGLPLTSADKRRAIGLALQDTFLAKLSNRIIARIVGCSDRLVAFMRSDLGVASKKVIGADGKEYTASKTKQSTTDNDALIRNKVAPSLRKQVCEFDDGQFTETNEGGENNDQITNETPATEDTCSEDISCEDDGIDQCKTEGSEQSEKRDSEPASEVQITDDVELTPSRRSKLTQLFSYIIAEIRLHCIAFDGAIQINVDPKQSIFTLQYSQNDNVKALITYDFDGYR